MNLRLITYRIAFFLCFLLPCWFDVSMQCVQKVIAAILSNFIYKYREVGYDELK